MTCRLTRHPGYVSRLSEVVAQVPSAVVAQLILGLLESEGIEAITSSDDAGGRSPSGS
jgi:predicted transcriptional regulator